ncbi:MAG TPA: hypothetical protein VK911_17865 [Vicinamibacterales bacterium]|nr:hypothetical protein [Vicinamibacterales bacterium]
MGLKDEVGALLHSGDEKALATRVAGDRRVIRLLVARLWDVDGGVRARAARALGEAAVHHATLVRENVRRLMWALNDESGTNGGPGLAALGEIGRRAPDIIAPYVPALAAFAADDGLRVRVLGALQALAGSAPALVAPEWAAVAGVVDLSRPDERAALDALRDTLEGRGV